VALTARCNKINGLQTNTNHSTQHGRNTTVRFPFTPSNKKNRRHEPAGFGTNTGLKSWDGSTIPQ
jgi:hypothetical protein